MKQEHNETDGNRRTLLLDTNYENPHKMVGFYYCYYEEYLATNEPKSSKLQELFDNNTASRIYVYVKSNLNQRKLHCFGYKLFLFKCRYQISICAWGSSNCECSYGNESISPVSTHFQGPNNHP